MKAKLLTKTLLMSSLGLLPCARAIDEPAGLLTRSGDRSVVVHWDRSSDTNLLGYRLYTSLNPAGPFTQVTPVQLFTSPSYTMVNATNGVTCYFQVAAVDKSSLESPRTNTVSATPRAFANDDEFLDYVQATAFDYLWYEANPANGMVRDRSTATSPCSIAAVGFALTGIGIGIDHGWISREQGRQRTLATLQTFWSKPQGLGSTGNIGYKGWFYHFLDMNTALRYTTFNTELSSIDTALLLAGVLYAKQYFDRDHPEEVAIRQLADGIYGRVDWNWMARGTNVFSMGWRPPTSWISSNWIGYNEAMLLYVMGLGATNPIPSSSWNAWTSGYTWLTYSGLSFVPFPPLFGHQYSHCWIDFRHVADPYMNARNTTYFENSRRVTLAQRLYCIANPLRHAGYGSNVWGITASDVPNGYMARGAPPEQNDEGTIAPTAPGGSVMFAPEVCIPALRYMYDRFRTNIWTGYGFRDAFNLGTNWWGSDTLGIDQGPIVISIENYRTQRVWKRFMQNPEIRLGLERAGFKELGFASPTITPVPDQGSMRLDWDASAGRTYQVEYSPDLDSWFTSPTGQQTAAGSTLSWTDSGPPGTLLAPADSARRFYKVLRFGEP